MFCSDTWRKPIPENKLMAYQKLLRDGTITVSRVIFNKTDKSTLIEYESTIPHDEVLARMRELSKEATQ